MLESVKTCNSHAATCFMHEKKKPTQNKKLGKMHLATLTLHVLSGGALCKDITGFYNGRL